MDNQKDDGYYGSKALEEINIIQSYFNNKTYEEFLGDSELIDAIMFRLIQLIENIKKISDCFKDKYPDIPWGKIIGFRNGIVREYGKTDYFIVYETILYDLKELKIALETL